MGRAVDSKLIERGIKVADAKVYQQDKIWSRYSNDKVDIGETLARVIRTLARAFPLSRPLRALSVGSSNEPQFRLLETAFRGGLYLLDIEKEALEVVQERIHRQCTDHVFPILNNFTKIFSHDRSTCRFRTSKLDGKKMNLITLHHSLYYCEASGWSTIFTNLYRHILAPKGAIHAVLMAADSDDPHTTTGLYNHFAGKFFGHHNNQNLFTFRKAVQSNRLFSKAQIHIKRSCVNFFVDDFEQFMAVIWMILLYPGVHQYTQQQKEEITEFVYRRFWKKKKPLLQVQDHLVLYRGLGFRGLI